MLYIDGAEFHGVDGPAWYWLAQQPKSLIARIRRPVLLQASVVVPWTWHAVSRTACDDYATIATKQHLDYGKLQTWRAMAHSFLPAELGWWGILPAAPDRQTKI
jgi:hypothetical protein